MSEFLLPSLGADMEAATLVEWHTQPGAKIKNGDLIVSVETDKGIIDVEFSGDGIIDNLLVQPGTKVPVGTALASYHAEGETATSTVMVNKPSGTKTPEAKPIDIKPVSIKPAEIKSVEHKTADEHQRVSPAARRRARELSIATDGIRGTGPHGAISIEDIEKAAAHTAEKEKSASGMRRVIAAAMARSKREIPHYYLGTTIDLTQALNWLEQQNSKRGVTDRIVPALLLLKATALAAKKVPEINGLWKNDSFMASTTVHMGVAISLRQGGLVVPTLRDVDKKDLVTLMHDFDDLVLRARSGHLRSSELLDSTLTVTSLGDQGVETVIPIIYPPQVAIVGFGSVVERPWSVAGKIESRRVVTATLAADHRVSDGHRGGLFLAAINRFLQEPETL